MFRRFTRVKVKEIEEIKLIHQREFSELIHRMNHEGMIPNAATATGLMNLILWAVSNSIMTLEKLYANKDWNTQEVITNLREIAIEELGLLHKKLGDFLESKRNVLKDYDRQQGL
jgi:hypothetical protein